MKRSKTRCIVWLMSSLSWTISRGEDWVLNTENLSELRKFADNEDLQSEWRAAKRINKLKIVSFLKEKTGYSVSPDAMLDIQGYGKDPVVAKEAIQEANRNGSDVILVDATGRMQEWRKGLKSLHVDTIIKIKKGTS